ncbi:hypothetical protein PALI_a3642 [Pseudoalteromonas aliena SW19]|uniref:Uncharacterized protein n=1 Tax=Pseudoalteromonas aliena SW19 TaxID=1314866 RepID=A0ABR9DWT9_9GAMM|nr:hypothetical protein [Pseudoalteromonas aliena SW19]
MAMAYLSAIKELPHKKVAIIKHKLAGIKSNLLNLIKSDPSMNIFNLFKNTELV